MPKDRRPTAAVFGAFDRFNYGDLLFPIILRRYLEDLEQDRRLEFVALRRSDFRRSDGVVTKPLRWLNDPENLPDGSVVIAAGGEVLGAGWSALHCHHLPQAFGDLVIKKLSQLRSTELADRLSRKYFGGRWEIPFVVRPGYFRNRVRTVFNAVGGTGLGEMPEAWRGEIETALGEASFASVRDRQTLGLVNRNAEVATLAADCAGVVADLFPLGWLEGRIRPQAERVLDHSPGGYVCFQIHRYFGEKRRREFASELSQFCGVTGMKVVLLPIGSAAGHSDQLSLREVAREMRGDVTLLEECGVYDILALIAGARLVVASSLHAAITATSYGVPFISFTKIPKCAAFLDTWCREPFSGTIEPDRLSDQMIARMQASEELAPTTRAIRESAHAGLKAVAEVVSSDL